MSSPVEIDYCGEGPTDAEIARRLIRAAGAEPGTDYLTTRRGRGKDSLDRRLAGFNAGARFRPVLVLRDLDRDEPCAGALAARLLPNRLPGMVLRIAVRAAESWLLADQAAFAKAFGVPPAILPSAPETLASPKHELAALLHRSSRSDVKRRLAASGAAASPQLLGEWLTDFA